MTPELNASEIFDIAERIELNGAMFYRRAAEIFEEPVVKRIFLKLADWELRHKQIFAGMKKECSELNLEKRTSISGQKLPDAKVMAALAVFGIRPEPADALSGRERVPEILKRAIENEKDSIVFYNGLKDFASAEITKEKIDDIIREELRHIRILNKVWQKLALPE